MLEQQTTIFLAGLTAALLPLLMGWLAPTGEIHPGSRWWYLGSLAAAAGLVLLALRSALPVWLGNHVGNTCLLIALLLWAQSLRSDLGHGWRARTVGWSCLLALAYYSATHEFLSLPERIALNRSVMGLQALYIAQVAWQLSRRLGSRNAQALMVCYVLLGLGLWATVGEVLTVPLSQDSRGVPQNIPGSPAWLTLVTATISSFCYLGIMLEHAARHKAQALQARSMADENARLDDRLHDADHKHRLVLAAGSLAHELNQPLSAALTRLELAERLLDRPDVHAEELHAQLDKAQASLWRTHEIMGRIRLAARAKALQPTSLDLREVVKTACDLMAGECAALGIGLKMELPAQSLMCRGDAVQLSQVLVNLLRNAAQAHARHIEVSASGEGAQVTVSVGDDGTGIAASVLARWGEPFAGAREEGLGLGLAICRAIVQQHGGQMDLANIPAGGARVRLQLAALKEAGP